MYKTIDTTQSTTMRVGLIREDFRTKYYDTLDEITGTKAYDKHYKGYKTPEEYPLPHNVVRDISFIEALIENEHLLKTFTNCTFKGVTSLTRSIHFRNCEFRNCRLSGVSDIAFTNCKFTNCKIELNKADLVNFASDCKFEDCRIEVTLPIVVVENLNDFQA